MPPDDVPDDLRRPLDESLPPRLRAAVPPSPETGDGPQAEADPLAEAGGGPPAPVAAPPPPPADDEPATEPDRPAGAAEVEAAADQDPAGAPAAADKDTADKDTADKDTADKDTADKDAAGEEAVAKDQPAAAGAASPGRPGRTAVLTRVATVPVHSARRAARATAAWSRRPTGRFAVPALLIALLLGAAAVGGGVLVPTVSTAGTSLPSPTAAAPTGAGLPPAPVGPTAPPPVGPTGLPGQDPFAPVARAEALRGWAEQTSTRTGVPVIALQAYGYAELVVAQTHPNCQLSWTTLAAIGRVESNHGSTNGARLLPDGRTDPTIIGLPLDGQDNRMLIPDTDAGAMDGDTVYDRAVGPMQFIPQTWQGEAVDANGDGIADPHNINDAALASANYLCRHGRDLTTPTGWWGAVLAYNNLQSYAQDVFDAANLYGQQSRA